MSKTQLEKELLRYTKDLSKEALREVIDFVLFLRQEGRKKGTNCLSYDLSIMSARETTHLEIEFEDYKEIYPSN